MGSEMCIRDRSTNASQHRKRADDQPPKHTLGRSLERAQEFQRGRPARHRGQLKGDDDLAEHLSAFETLEPLFEIREGDFGIDHGR